MCQYSANDGVATDWHLTHLGMLANSGAGLVVAEMTDVERHGRISHGCLGLYSDACEVALERVVAHCHRIGTAKIAVQLAHAGRKGSARMPWEGRELGTAAPDPWPTMAPSAIPFGADWATPRAMTLEDIERIREAFAAAARRALRAGFDAIEMHMAHGYLLHSFVSPLSNRRNDEYGGTLEGRMRFPLEVARAVRAAVPKGTPVGARITGTDWVEGGLTGDDAVVFAGALKAEGLDYVDVSSGAIGCAMDATSAGSACGAAVTESEGAAADAAGTAAATSATGAGVSACDSAAGETGIGRLSLPARRSSIRRRRCSRSVIFRNSASLACSRARSSAATRGPTPRLRKNPMGPRINAKKASTPSRPSIGLPRPAWIQ